MNITDFFNPHELLGQAVWALLALSLLTAPMGCFVVWRKLSYFGATLAHSALLGAILGLVTGIGVITGVIGFTVILAILLSFWLNSRQLPSDTLLGIIAHLTLAVGVIAVSVLDNLRIDLMAYLLGNVLTISQAMFYIIIALSIIGSVVIIICWRGFVNLSISPEIAKVEGFNIHRVELIFTLVLSLTIALGMLNVGVLLVVAMLIIPAATARLLSHSLKQMVVLSWIATVISIVVGMIASYICNFPVEPSLVAIQGLLFIVIYMWNNYKYSK